MPGQNVGSGAIAAEGDAAFTDFMSAFRTEMNQARGQGERLHRFVLSSNIQRTQQAARESLAGNIFGVGVDADPSVADGSLTMAEEFDEWPDEFLLLGVAEEDAEAISSPSPASETSSTSETVSTEVTEDETDDDEEDTWPLEMLIG